LFFKDRVALVSVKQRDLDACGANTADTEGFCEKLRDVAGVEVSILIRVDGRFTKTSMRSLSGTVNVSEIAQSFNGGGHINAAGFRSKKSAKQVEEALLKSLEVIYNNK
jgi:phosphoesterase RecJ-like protein